MKILATFCRFPYPLDKGDKLRAFYQIKELSKANDIYLFCFSAHSPKQEHIQILQKYCKQIHIEKLSLISQIISLLCSLFKGLPFQVALFSTFRAKQNFKSFFSKVKPDVSYFQFVRMGEFAKIISGKKVLDFQDCLSKNMERRKENANFVKRIVFSLESKRLQRYENTMFDVFDSTTIITDTDRQLITSKQKNNIQIIENGVGEDFISYNKSFNKEYDIIFSGNMSYSPNVMAACFLVKDIMPLVWKKFPKCKVVLAGSSPTKEVESLSNDKVVVTGWVEDMKEYYAKSRVFIAPMQIGTGLQNKLLEAMAIGLPCITTSLANNALKSQSNKEILVADDKQSLANYIIELLSDQELYNKISLNGNNFVKTNYSWQNSVQKLNAIFQQIVSLQ